MSRVIRFRLWDTQATNDSVSRIRPKMRHPRDVDNFVIWALNETPDTHDPQSRYEVMQYTGLRDSAGVEIYEGDVISCMGGYEEGESELPGEVQFLEGSWYVISGSDSILLHEYDINRVIGNIYENPELQG